MVEDVLECDSELLFGFGIEMGDEQTEKFFDEDFFVSEGVFGKVVAELFYQEGHSHLELLCNSMIITWTGECFVELVLVFEEVEEFFYKIVHSEEGIEGSLGVGHICGGFGVVGELDEAQDFEIVGQGLVPGL